jgi:hypothetical protein
MNVDLLIVIIIFCLSVKPFERKTRCRVDQSAIHEIWRQESTSRFRVDSHGFTRVVFLLFPCCIFLEQVDLESAGFTKNKVAQKIYNFIGTTLTSFKIRWWQ